MTTPDRIRNRLEDKFYRIRPNLANIGRFHFPLVERFHNQIASPVGFTRSSLTSAIDELTQPAESVVPLFGNQIQVMAYLIKPSLIQLPDALPAMSAAAGKTRAFKYSQVLGDRLTSDIKTSAQPGDGSWAIITEARNYAQAGLISQRRKYRSRAYQWFPLWATLPRQDIFQSAL
jgi:hypothetical protein